MAKPEPEFVSAYANGKSGTVVTVSPGHAKAAGLTVLKSEPAVDKHGIPLAPRQKTSAASSDGNSKTSTSSGGNTTPVAASTPEEASK